MTKLRDDVHASRIWRTVVVAGAMLGAPLTAGANESAPASKTEKVSSRPAPPRSKTEVAKAANELVRSLGRELVELDKKILTTTKQLEAAKDQTAKTTLNATLKDQQKQRDDLKAKQTAAKVDAKRADADAKAEADANKPRPRPNPGKPVGRGFVLS